MWTETTREQFAREDLRVPSDLRDKEWEVIEPYFWGAGGAGRPRKHEPRRMLEAILFLLRSGAQWRMLPPGLYPPRTTVMSFFYKLRDTGVPAKVQRALLCMARERAGRNAEPTAVIIDSQSVKTTESGGPRGFDAGKKIKGRKRHICTDTQGNLVAAVVHGADIQDRDGGGKVMSLVKRHFPTVRKVFADAGYDSRNFRSDLSNLGDYDLEIVKRPRSAKGFVALPRRWVVERTIGWLNRNRRLAKDVERTVESATTWLLTASIQTMIRKIATPRNSCI